MKIGIILDSLGTTQSAFYAINKVNIALQGIDVDICFFFDDIVPPCIPPRTAVFSSGELFNFNNGALIATTIGQADSILQSVMNNVKILYLQDLEFLRGPRNRYLYNLGILTHPDLQLVCRSKSHADLVMNYCNTRPMLCDEFNVQQLLTIINQIYKEREVL